MSADVNTAVDELENASNLSEAKQIVMALVERLSTLAGWAKSKLTTFLVLAVLSAAWLAYVFKSVLGLELGAMSVIFTTLGLPAMAIFFFRSKLSSVEDLPESIREFEGALANAFNKMKEDKVVNNIGNLSNSKSKGLVQSIKELVKIGPSIMKLKDAFDEVGHPEVISDIAFVANPAFAPLIGLLSLTVGIMMFLSAIGALVMLFI